MSFQKEIERVIEYSPDTAKDQAEYIINKVLDAAIESNRRSAKELGLDEIEIHYLNEDLNKLRPKS